MTTTYSTYLKLDQLLTAQVPKSTGPEHDEMLFIIIHQVYELWFKQVLHETDYLITLLNDGDKPRILHTLRRILTIFKTLVSQIDILETMTPLEFLSFRDRLDSASGFQSFQFREFEFLLGYKRQNVMAHYKDSQTAVARLEARYEQPTLWDAFLKFLLGEGYAVSDLIADRDVTEALRPSPKLQAILKTIYLEDAITMRICERLLDLDEGIQEWRYRHIKMVERTIGTKKGTGGSTGVAYLRSTLQPIFPDLWAIRADL